MISLTSGLPTEEREVEGEGSEMAWLDDLEDLSYLRFSNESKAEGEVEVEVVVARKDLSTSKHRFSLRSEHLRPSSSCWESVERRFRPDEEEEVVEPAREEKSPHRFQPKPSFLVF